MNNKAPKLNKDGNPILDIGVPAKEMSELEKFLNSHVSVVVVGDKKAKP